MYNFYMFDAADNMLTWGQCAMHVIVSGELTQLAAELAADGKNVDYMLLAESADRGEPPSVTQYRWRKTHWQRI